MANILLFHHAQGQTPGFLEFAEQLRQAGHTVHAPDLYDGKTFDDLDEGVAYAEEVTMSEVIARGTATAEGMPKDLYYGGFSLGALPAQALAQGRPGALGAILFHGGVPTSSFDLPWPDGVRLQMHLMAGDEWCEPEVNEALAKEISGAELYVYPGSGHLFADPGSPDYEPASAALLMTRTLAFLDA